MLNPTYFYDKVQELFAEFKPDYNLEQARLRMMESAMWLSHATPTDEAINRDQAAAPSPRIIRHPGEQEPLDWTIRAKNKLTTLEYYNQDTLPKVFGALIDGGMNGAEARETISLMQSAGILFRERLPSSGEVTSTLDVTPEPGKAD